MAFNQSACAKCLVYFYNLQTKTENDVTLFSFTTIDRTDRRTMIAIPCYAKGSRFNCFNLE